MNDITLAWISLLLAEQSEDLTELYLIQEQLNKEK